MKLIKVPYFFQKKEYTCGPASLKMVFDFFGLRLSENEISKQAHTSIKLGTKHKYLIETAIKNKFYCYVHENANNNQIKHFIDQGFPVIVDYIEPSYNEGHYSVIIGYTKRKFILNDPWNGKKFKINYKKFDKRWHDKIKNSYSHKWIMVLSKKKFDLGKEYLPK